MNIKENIFKNLINFSGWKTNRRIIIFESDDWGSIRMPSRKVYNHFLNKGFNVDRCHYSRNDCLENNDDLLGLIEVLSNFKDINGNNAQVTINSLVANPDFEKIKNSNYTSYFFEEVTDTLKKYERSNKVIELYKEAIDSKILKMQFHGREHLNINRWMSVLHSGDEVTREIFDRNMFTIHLNQKASGRKQNLDAFGFGYSKEFESIQSVISSGVSLFENIWGYKSKSFIAPNYFWNNVIEKEMSKHSINYIQGTHIQKIPINGRSLDFKKKYHYLGQKNKRNQTYLVRNAFFEPSSDLNRDWISSCLREIGNAFYWNKPAIICSHRVNYIGSINPENRSKNLKMLNQLLSEINKSFSNVEYMTSDQLGDLIDN